jgi:glycosyltransferase involved in cell wall biosynthesis
LQVSVIIPVYNAVAYVERAVVSAVALTEVTEVILVDDGYPDGSLELCKTLAQTYSKVTLYQHPDGQNRGAGASRNLGIKHATCDYIAFLDADDYFLPNRFDNTQRIFASDTNISAVYEPVGTDYISEAAREDFCKFKGISKEASYDYVSHPKKPLKGREFFYSLIDGSNGYPHTDGVTLKAQVLAQSGLFNEGLRLHQDTELWLRLAYYGDFASPESRLPVAMRGVHEENRIHNVSFQSQYLLVKTMKDWADTVELDKQYRRLILKRYITGKIRANFNSNSVVVKIIYRCSYFLILLLNYKYW